jgi:hypothetical protein
MKSIMFIHNGDYKNKNPFWTIRMGEKGHAIGEVIGPRTGYSAIESFEKQLPEELIVDLFLLPENLVRHEITSQPERNEVIVHFKENGCPVGVFLVSQVEEGSSYRRVLQTAVDFLMKDYTEQGGGEVRS